MKYIDLSYTVNNEIAVSKYDVKPSLTRVKFLERDYYNDTEINSTMHIGTHIDAPSHMLDSDLFVSDYDISTFIGKGVFLNYENEVDLTLREEDESKIVEGSIVMVYTNMDKVNGTKEYYETHPVISMELCECLIQKKVKVVALDFYSPDKFPFEIHKKLLSNNILIVENVKNAHLLKDIKEFTLHMIPMKIDAEGSFVRAYASYE